MSSASDSKLRLSEFAPQIQLEMGGGEGGLWQTTGPALMLSEVTFAGIASESNVLQASDCLSVPCKVKARQPVMTYSQPLIRDKGYSTICVVKTPHATADWRCRTVERGRPPCRRHYLSFKIGNSAATTRIPMTNNRVLTFQGRG